MNVIVGSGPAGMAAALALTAQGRPVTLIDAGETLDAEHQAVVNRLQAQTPEQWDPNDLRTLRGNTDARVHGIPLKHAYGSLYHVSGVNEHILENSDAFRTLVSLAQGGLSSVWGAAILPYSDEDLKSWPIKPEDLRPHYRAILSEIPVSVPQDALSERYPLDVAHPKALRMSKQAQAFHSDLERNQSSLTNQGFSFGAARLAVQVAGREKEPGCVYCGLCLFGCPYGFIFNAAQMLPQLRRNANFHYFSGIIVDKLIEHEETVDLIGRRNPGQAPWQLQASRVFLGSGVLSTARILLNSMQAPERELTVRSSQHFMFPLIRYSNTPDVTSEKLHTLSQIFIEYRDRLSEYGVHLQVYSFNDLYAMALKRLFGPFYSVLRAPLERFILGRLLILQGYLHSAYSPSLKIALDPSTSRLRVRPDYPDGVSARIRSVTNVLWKNARKLRALPITPVLKISVAGVGAHIGGSFPMKKDPAPFETDTLGVPSGMRRTHVIDASTFPDIPSTTITLTIMANAHRIASSAAGEER